MEVDFCKTNGHFVRDMRVRRHVSVGGPEGARRPRFRRARTRAIPSLFIARGISSCPVTNPLHVPSQYSLVSVPDVNPAPHPLFGRLQGLGSPADPTTRGPLWGYLKSQFSRDLVKFWQQMPTKWLQERARTGLGYPHIGPSVAPTPSTRYSP